MAIRGALRAELEAVREATFANPFSPRRQDLDLRMAGLASSPRADTQSAAERQAAFEQRHGRLRAAIEALGGSALRLDTASPSDRALIEPALLFFYLHELWPQLTALHERPPAKEGQSVRVDFVRPVLAVLSGHGISEDRASRLVALFWQIWRAYAFIDRGLVGRSPSMIRLRERLWSSVFGRDLALYEQTLLGKMEDFSTILLGATGTGKGAAAAAIGHSGFVPLDERGNAFVSCHHSLFLAINPSQYAEGLIESELFGHRRGSFTGAVDSHVGIFAKSTPYGTVFIDEIGEISTALQIKLLKVLQDRVFHAVGSHDALRFSGRVLAATHRDLAQRREEGSIRDDFYYRLCGEVIELPSLATRLSERPSELTELVHSLLVRSLGESAASLATTVCEQLQRDVGSDYAWPGNVRELEQAVRRILVAGSYEGDPRLRFAHASQPASTQRKQTPSARPSADLPPPTLSEVQRSYFAELYARHPSYEHVARLAGVDRRTVRRFLQPVTPGPSPRSHSSLK